MIIDVDDVLDDLVAEQLTLDSIVEGLSIDDWARPTPSPGWTIADQIGHLAFFDAAAALAISDPDEFDRQRTRLLATFRGDDRATDQATLGAFRQLGPAEQLAEWRIHRVELEAAGRTLDDDTRVEWYGPSMGAKSFLTARLMEVWAHGQDVCDAIGVTRAPSDRIRHIAQLGVITRGWSYLVRDDDAPETAVRVALEAPSGAVWTWGDDDAPESISGPAVDFALVVTQRRHVDDTDLVVDGDAAREWMLKAQAFAGTPTTGPAPKETS